MSLDLGAIRALTEAEYEPIRSALFDGPPGQGSQAAKRKIAEHLSAAGYQIVLVAEVERLRKQRGVAEMLATRAWQLWAGLPTELQESEAGQRFIGAFGGFSAYFEESSESR